MEVKVNSKGHNYIESLSKTGEVIWSITQNYPSNATKLEEDESIDYEDIFDDDSDEWTSGSQTVDNFLCSIMEKCL